MGGCASRVQQWKEEAEEEVKAHPTPPPPPPKLPEAAAQAAAAHDRDPSHQWFFRHSQELSMAHLVRHPRLQPFAPPAGGQFGIEPLYHPIKLLGRGGTGQTWLCREDGSDRLYAVKLQQRPIPRSTVRLTYNEVTIGASTCVSSVYMSHIKEVMLTPSHLALVLDYEAGGSAAEFVAQQIPQVSQLSLVVDEGTAQYMFKQLVAGLQHLHENSVAHRDVKLDNTLLTGEQPPGVKLCDFQFAKFYGLPQLTRMKTHLGTAVYMSPELLENRQSRKSYDPVEVDVWAAGIWLVALLCGAFPFDNRQILHQEMSQAWMDSKFVKPYVAQLSGEAIDLLNHILHVDPSQRATLEDISAHPWLRRPLPPHLEAAWQRTRREQLQLERRLSMLTPDHGLVHQRNTCVFELLHSLPGPVQVREAALPTEQWEASFARLSQACARAPQHLVDCGAALAHVVRIDMRPDAVARRLSEKALALLDSPAALDASPPATPQRFSLPLQTIASDQSLASMVPGGGEPEPLKPLQPSPLGLPPGAPRAYAHSHSASAASSAAAEDERLRALSPFAAPTV